MTEEIYRPFDAAEHLKTAEDIAAYLDRAVEEAGDDTGYITHALGVVARARSMSRLSRDTEISREGLYKALSTDGNPSFATVVRVARALGVKVTFEAV